MKLRVGLYHIIRTLPKVNLQVQLSHGHWSLENTEGGAQTHHLVGQIDLIVQNRHLGQETGPGFMRTGSLLNMNLSNNILKLHLHAVKNPISS